MSFESNEDTVAGGSGTKLVDEIINNGSSEYRKELDSDGPRENLVASSAIGADNETLGLPAGDGVRMSSEELQKNALRKPAMRT